MGFLKDLKVRLGLDNSGFKKGLEDSKKDVGGFGSVITKMGGLIAGAFAVRAIINFGKELLTLGGQAEGVRAAFKKIGGEPYLDDLRKATKGTVSDLDLMKQAVQANNFDIPLKNLGGLFEFARRRAKSTGESVDYLTQSIVTGIGRKSPLILDNLGISAAQLTQELNGASVASASVGEITAAVEKIAGNALKNMAEDTTTAAERTAAHEAAWLNLKTAIGSTLTQANSFFTKTTTYMNNMSDIMNDDVLTGWQKFKAAMGFSKELQNVVLHNKYLKEAAANLDLSTKSAEELQKINYDYNKLRWDTGDKGYLAFVEAVDAEFQARENNANKIKLEEEALKLKNEQAKKELEIANAKAESDRANKAIRDELSKKTTTKRPKETVSVKVSLEPEYENLALGLDTVKIAASLPKIPIDIEISSMSRQVLEGLNPMTEAEERTAEFVSNMGVYAEDFKNSAVAGFSDGMQLMADSLFAGEDFDAGAMVAALLTPLADMAIRTGEIAIGIGIGIEAIKTSLATLGGIGAIAAGVALIAIGATAKSLLKSASKGGGSGGTSSRNSGSGLQAQPVTGGVNMIQGGESSSMSNSGGGSLADQLGDVKFMINGDNLVGIFDRNNNRRKKY